MLNHCLLSVDDSPEWENLLAFLPAMSKLLSIKHLTLVYVVDVTGHRQGWDTKETAARRLEALADKLQGDLGIEVGCKVRAGLPAAETLKCARALKADGVITCNRSHSASRELFLGNTALNLARMTHVPLLIIPLDGEPPSLDGPVVLATDCSRAAEEARNQFGTLVESGASGIVMSVNEVAAEHEHEPVQTVDAIANQYTGVESLELTGHPIERILELSEEEHAPLVILGKRGHTPIKELPLGSTAETVARASRRPVLLVPG